MVSSACASGVSPESDIKISLRKGIYIVDTLCFKRSVLQTSLAQGRVHSTPPYSQNRYLWITLGINRIPPLNMRSGHPWRIGRVPCQKVAAEKSMFST